MPFALDEVRKLGRSGHETFASDTFSFAPGGWSRFVSRRFETPSPRRAPLRFLEAVKRIVRQHSVELILPAFEEALLLARHVAELGTRLFAPSFETLHMLHHKVSFVELARKLDLRAPRTTVIENASALRDAVRRHETYLARPALSRGGVDLLTNRGPLAGALPIEDCQPTPQNPWILQPFVEGIDVCTFGIARRGALTAHVTYVHPREIEHSGGIVFESVHEPAALEITRRLVEATNYDGQISLDLMLTREGYVVIECNPRPTCGVCLLDDDEFCHAVFDAPGQAPFIAPAGRARKLVMALVRDMLLHSGSARLDLPHLRSSARDLYAEPGDWMPSLLQVLSYGHVLTSRAWRSGPHRPRTLLTRGYLEDVSWNWPISPSLVETAPSDVSSPD